MFTEFPEVLGEHRISEEAANLVNLVLHVLLSTNWEDTCADELVVFFINPWNIGTADLYRQQQFPHYCRICGMYGDFCIPTVFTRHSDAIPCEILGGQS